MLPVVPLSYHRNMLLYVYIICLSEKVSETSFSVLVDIIIGHF